MKKSFSLKLVKILSVTASALVLILLIAAVSGCDLSSITDKLPGFSHTWDTTESGTTTLYPVITHAEDTDNGTTTLYPVVTHAEITDSTTADTDVTTTAEHPVPVSLGNVEVHVLELGNKYAGDCIYIRAGDCDILIDAGSRNTSIPTIKKYLDSNMPDNSLEYVIVTHAHADHYAGFATYANTNSIFDLYDCKNIIDFAMTNQKSDAAMYVNYLRERNDEIAKGANHYTAAECRKSGNYIFDLGYGVTLEVLDNYYYYNESGSENNYSVCVLIRQGDNSFLFTGDLEEIGEKKLTELNELPSSVTLYKAGHHGSKTSTSALFMAAVKPKIACVSCVCGSDEYTPKNENQFPTQLFVNNIAPYTDAVYVTSIMLDNEKDTFTSMNGNIVVISDGDGVRVNCSASNLKLVETEWFKTFRTMPDAWKKAS